MDTHLLHYAAEHLHAHIVKLLLEVILAVTRHNFGFIRPLHWATLQSDHLPAAKFSAQHRKFINTHLYDLTPLSIAAILGHQKIVTLLLDQGADPNLSNIVGHTALHLSISNKQTEISKFLLQAKADPTKASNNSDAPLHWAVKHNQCQIVEDLI